MNFLQKIFGSSNKVEIPDQPIEKKYANFNEAKLFFNSLISDMSSEYTISSYADILQAYRTVPALSTIIDTSAKAFVRGKRNLYKTDNENNKTLIESGNLYDILRKPHFLQSENEFWEAFYINWQLYGVTYNYKKSITGLKLKSLLCLPTIDVEVIEKENADFLTADQLSDIIDYYKIDQGNGIILNETNIEKIWTLQNWVGSEEEDPAEWIENLENYGRVIAERDFVGEMNFNF